MRLRRSYGHVARTVRGLAWLTMIAGFFLSFFGAGSRDWAYSYAAGGLLTVAGALWLGARLTKGRSSRSYVVGTVHVVKVSEPPVDAQFGRCELQVLVDAPGHPGQTVVIRDPRVPVSKWPDVGDTLPALVAVDDARRIKIQWDRIATHSEVAEFEEHPAFEEAP